MKMKTIKTKITEVTLGLWGLGWFMGLWVWKSIEKAIWKKA
jgi:hypothetical protein